MGPEVALIITFIIIAFVLFIIVYLSIMCGKAIKKLKVYGESVFNKKQKPKK